MVPLSIIIPILFWPSEKPLWRAIDATATMIRYNPKLARFIHQTTWKRVFNHEGINVRWSDKSDSRKNELNMTYRVPQQVNTILCVIHSRKPQSLYRNKPRTFVVKSSYAFNLTLYHRSLNAPDSWWANARVLSSSHCLWVSSHCYPKKHILYQ